MTETRAHCSPVCSASEQGPRLLDLCCYAGGTAVGYRRAGFGLIVGVDIRPSPRYPFEFVQADAFEYLIEHGQEFDCIHCSPPCQAYSQANHIHGRTDHPDLVSRFRKLLLATGKIYVIENVPGAPLHFPVQVCGLSLGLRVRRHRWFESNAFLFGTNCRNHASDYAIVFGGGGRTRAHCIGRTAKNGPITRRGTLSLDKCKAAMGIDWMTRDELSQAVPPAYTEYLGRQLISRIEEAKSC